MNYVKRIIIAFTILALTALVLGYGEKETNTPAVKLTASVVTSLADATAHTHTVIIPFTDVSAAPAVDSYQYSGATWIRLQGVPNFQKNT